MPAAIKKNPADQLGFFCALHLRPALARCSYVQFSSRQRSDPSLGDLCILLRLHTRHANRAYHFALMDHRHAAFEHRLERCAQERGTATLDDLFVDTAFAAA